MKIAAKLQGNVANLCVRKAVESSCKSESDWPWLCPEKSLRLPALQLGACCCDSDLPRHPAANLWVGIGQPWALCNPTTLRSTCAA